MSIYKITSDSKRHRAALEKKLFGLDLVAKEMKEMILVAWMTAWASSTHKNLEDIPWSANNLDYWLMDHVNEVTQIGITLAGSARGIWKSKIDQKMLIPILILHDVDKPLLYEKKDGKYVRTQLAGEIPHGVIGGMLLRELGFADPIVKAVTTHSPLMPFQGKSQEAYVLHYADHFACDNALLRLGQKPLYFLQGHPAIN